jgi:copper(I)-binding protein
MNRSLPLRLLVGALLFVLLAACHRGSDAVTITDGRVTIPPPGAHMAAGYFTIENGTSKDVEVKSLSSPVFESVEMHETRTENGVSSMHALDSLHVPAGGKVTFAPGGKHLMLMGPRAALDPGQSLVIILTITSAEGPASQVPATFQVGESGQPPAH